MNKKDFNWFVKKMAERGTVVMVDDKVQIPTEEEE